MTKCILVIDDFAPARKLFIHALEDTPYLVYAAESGAKGLELQKKFKFDLIFLDLNMPGMSGIETLREIRKTDRELPVYIVTALYKDYLDEIKNAVDDGIKFLIAHKPITPDQIVLISKDILEGSKVHQ